MAYNYASDTISALLISEGFVESKETITLDELPSSISDKAFSVTLESIEPSGTDVHDRFFPVEVVKITAIYFIGNNSFAKYENGIDWNEDLISLVMNPSNYHSSVRVIHFAGSKTSLKAGEAKNYVIIENTFNVEVTLLYVPDLTDNTYTDSSTEETIDAGTY